MQPGYAGFLYCAPVGLPALSLVSQQSCGSDQENDYQCACMKRAASGAVCEESCCEAPWPLAMWVFTQPNKDITRLKVGGGGG
jgi:hypothetical protein